MKKVHIHCRKGARNGFTLIEVMIAVSLFTLIVGGTISVYLMCQRVWHSTSLKIQTTQDANMAIARIVYGLGTNSGLRSASSAVVDTNMRGIWPGTNYPPSPGDTTHYLDTGTPDSWRITFSNAFDGLHYIDYNRLARNIVYWPVVGNPSSRQLICNYVANATATNTGGGIFITITTLRQDGQFTASNQVSTFIFMRNQ